MKQFLLPAALLAACGFAWAKLPPPAPLDDAAKLKAAETAARTAWQGKVDNYLLCKAQDRVAAAYRKSAGKPAMVTAAATPPGAAPAKPAAVAAPAAAAAAPAAPIGTPVATGPAPIPPCGDPGPFAFTPPEQKPLEAAGAHSPPGTASSPPNTRAPAATTPDKKS